MDQVLIASLFTALLLFLAWRFVEWAGGSEPFWPANWRTSRLLRARRRQRRARERRIAELMDSGLIESDAEGIVEREARTQSKELAQHYT